MANYVTNLLTLNGPVKSLQGFIDRAQGQNSLGEDSLFSLHAFIPMPEDVYRGPLGLKEYKKYPAEKNWSGWSMIHWGSEKDAYGVTEDEVSAPIFLDEGKTTVRVLFDTSWRPPTPVIKKISELFPRLQIIHQWGDEDVYGCNHGVQSFVAGVQLYESFIDGDPPTKEKREHFIEIWGKDPYPQENEDN